MHLNQVSKASTEKYILPKEYSFHGPFLVQEEAIFVQSSWRVKKEADTPK